MDCEITEGGREERWIGTSILKKEKANEDCGGYCYHDSTRKNGDKEMV